MKDICFKDGYKRNKYDFIVYNTNLTMLSFEHFENHEEWRRWFDQNWDLGPFIALIYLIVIWVGQLMMKKRKPFLLRKQLIIWNITMAYVSSMGTWRMFPEVLNIPRPFNLQQSWCFNDRYFPTTQTWKFFFVFFKLAQMGDSIFLVLRKRPIHSMHLHKHASVTVLCWYGYSFNDPSAWWFCFLNYFTGTLSYTYNSLRACKNKVAQTICLFFTDFLVKLQMTEMCLGLCINVYTFTMIWNNVPCNRDICNVSLSTFLFFTYYRHYVKLVCEKSPFVSKYVKMLEINEESDSEEEPGADCDTPPRYGNGNKKRKDNKKQTRRRRRRGRR